MKVLALIFSFNDADVIGQTVAAIASQTRSVDEIVVVDNASTDGTLEQPGVRTVTVIRNRENLGASGAVCVGFRYALEHGYDWVWTFDADAAPEPDALEKKLALFAGWPAQVQDQTGFIACLHRNARDGAPLYYHSQVLTRYGWLPIKPSAGQRYHRCDFTTWSGCLFRLAAVRQAGSPNANYFADFGEAEYGYRLLKAGYREIMYEDAVHNHNVRGYASLRPVAVKRGARTVIVLQVPPLRYYYGARNRLYLILYEFAELRPWMIGRAVYQLTVIAAKLLVRPQANRAQIPAFLRGVWHGLTGNIAARY